MRQAWRREADLSSLPFQGGFLENKRMSIRNSIIAFSFYLAALLLSSQSVGIQLPTGFEANNGAATTTLEEEIEFLNALASMSPRVSVQEVGRSVEDRPIFLVTLGYPLAAEANAIQPGQNLIFIGLQHGNEPAGREGMLRFMRKLAFTDDAAWLELMSDTPVLLIPTLNPDALPRDIRNNVQGIDINRDHVAFRTPEGRLLGEILQRFQPAIMVDAHEGPSTPNNPDQNARIEMLWPGNRNTHPEILRLSRSMVEDYCLPGLRQAGFGTGIWRGRAGREDVLRSNGGLRHMISVVVESFRSTPDERARAQKQTFIETLRFYKSNQEEIQRVLSEVRSSPSPFPRFYLDGTLDESPGPDLIEEPVMAGYLLNSAQRSQIEPQIIGFGITYHTRDDGAVFIPMDQPAWPVIPLFLDERAPRHLVQAVPVRSMENIATKETAPEPLPDSPPAQHFVDFSQIRSNQLNSEWDSIWTSSSWTLARGDGGRQVLRHQLDTSRDRRAFVWKGLGEITGDVEVTTKLNAVSRNTLFQLPIHVSGERDNESAYYLDVRLSTDSLRINLYNGGRFSTLASVHFDFVLGTVYQIRFQRSGDVLRGKIWPASEQEPSEWMVQVTNTVLNTGYVGFSGVEASSTNDWFFLGVGVGGEEAPSQSLR